MNELIKELAEQAGIKITPMVIDGVEYEYEDVNMDGSEDLQKFAELLIQKCCDTITKEGDGETWDDWDRGYNMGLLTSVDSIKKYFGVEE